MRFKSEHRRYEFAAARVLLHKMLTEEADNTYLSPDALSSVRKDQKQCEEKIAYLPSGRPYLVSGKYHISISHTHGYVAVILSRNNQVGIDVEQIRTKAFALRSKFIRIDEVADTLTKILLHWSAKETAFKIIDQPDTSYLEHLYVEPFTQGLVPDEKLIDSGNLILAPSAPYSLSNGTFFLQELRTPMHQIFEIHYRVYPYFVLTYTKVKASTK